MSEILLPKSRDGRQYLSYSQIKSWKSAKSFNLSIEGKLEYMLEYFFGEEFGDMGWAQFGTEVEEYITERKHADKFTDKEKETLDSITTLGVFQKEGWIHFDDFDVLLYIDDCTTDLSHIRDYKTASENSSKQYYKDDYWQMDVYGMFCKQETGKLPEKAEMVIIERAGNCFRGGGRGVLSVKDRVWYHDRELTEKRQMILKQDIKDVAYEISECYKMFLKLTGC